MSCRVGESDFVCKTKTASEMRVSYWSSGVCSSDRRGFLRDAEAIAAAEHKQMGGAAKGRDRQRPVERERLLELAGQGGQRRFERVILGPCGDQRRDCCQ